MDTMSEFLQSWNDKYPGKKPPDVSFLTAGAGRGRTKYVLQDEVVRIDETISRLRFEIEQQEFLKSWIEKELEELEGLGKAVALLKGDRSGGSKNMARGGLGGSLNTSLLLTAAPSSGVGSEHQNSFETSQGRENKFKLRHRENAYETIDDFPMATKPPNGTFKAGSYPPPGPGKNKEVTPPPHVLRMGMGGTSTGDLYTQVKKPRPEIKPKPASFRHSTSSRREVGGFGQPAVQPNLHQKMLETSPVLEKLKNRQLQQQNNDTDKPEAGLCVPKSPKSPTPAEENLYDQVGDAPPKEPRKQRSIYENTGQFVEQKNPIYEGFNEERKEDEVKYETVHEESSKNNGNEYMTVGEENLDSIGSEGNFPVPSPFDFIRSRLAGGGPESASASDDSYNDSESGDQDEDQGFHGPKPQSSNSKKSVRIMEPESDGTSVDSVSLSFGDTPSPVDMRKLVVAGILESDAVYRECLETLRHYMRLLKASSTTSQPAMAMDDYDIIFYKIDEIYDMNTEFYETLKARLDNWTAKQQVGDLFLDATRNLGIYADYLNNYQRAMETVEKCRRENENFEMVAERIPKPSSKENLVTLEGLLYRPLQRITKMTLTLHDLMKHTPQGSADYKALRTALRTSEEFLSQVNERAKLKGKLKKQHKKSANSKSDKKKRKLLKDGYIVEQVDRNTRKLRHFFLYTDVIICAKQKTTTGILSGPKEQYDCKWYIPLPDLFLNLQDDQGPVTPSISLSSEKELEGLRARISEAKMNIRSDSHGDGKKLNRGAQKNIDKNRKKLAELEGQMLLISPNLPLRLTNKDGKTYTLLMSSDYERSDWREAIAARIAEVKKDTTAKPVSLTAFEIQNLTSREKCKSSPLNVSSMLIKDDEELMSGILKVNIKAAKNLHLEGGYYCCLEVDSYGHFSLVAKTNCRPGRTEVEWNQEFELDIDGAQTIRILCYRQDSASGDMLIGKGAQEMPKLNQKEINMTVNLDSIDVTISLSYDSHGRQTMKRHKSKRTGGMFAVHIGKVTKREGNKIPSIITICCREIERRGLSEMGIYRISGVTTDIQKLKKAFENNSKLVDTLVAESDIHAIACVIKLYFRELPEPLFTNELYQNFVNGIALSDVHARQNCMVSLLENLPEPNKSTVTYLLEHLRRVATNEGENKMSLHNLATVFGPNLLRPSLNTDEDNASLQSAMLLEATCFTNVMAQVGVFLYYLEGRAEPATETHDL